MTKIKFIYITAILLFFVQSYPVSADFGEIVPYISLKQEYSDNILFSKNNEEDDFLTTASAGVVFSRDTERVDATLDAQLMQLFYLDNDQLDSLDGAVSGTWYYQVTERAGMAAAVGFREDSRRDMDTDTTGLVLSGDREEMNFSASSNYLFSETTRGKATLNYGFTKVDETNDDEDDDTLRLDLSFSRNLSRTFKNTVGLMNFSYLHYTADIEGIAPGRINYWDFTSDVFIITAGFSRDITELYKVYLQAGVSYTDTTEEQKIRLTSVPTKYINRTDHDSSTWGGVLAAGLNYDGLYYDVGLSLSHDVRGSSNSNGSVERSAVSLKIDRKISEDFFITFNTSCYLNRNERRTSEDLDDLTFNIQPGFRCEIFEGLTLSAVYRYTSVKDRQNDTTSERNLVYVVIRKDFYL